MKEARIILATDTKDNRPIKATIRELLRNKLANNFGGFTETMGYGGYIMADGILKTEAVYIYDVAMPHQDFPALRAIAAWLRIVAEQETVYLRDPDGNVAFVADPPQYRNRQTGELADIP